MSKKDVLRKINSKLSLINNELKEGFNVKNLNNMVIEDVINNNVPILLNTKDFSNFEALHYLEKASYEIYKTINKIREEVELDDFISSNKSFDIKRLKVLYKSKRLNKRFPNFKIDKYLELLNNPILEIKNFKGQLVKFDLFWVKKQLIAFNQMIFNEMDLYILNIGKEGSGKSCWSSQQILYFYTFLDKVGLIDYAYDIRRMFFADILSFLEENENEDFNSYFKIKCLDEGNELNRSNFREETTQQFKYEMRTERKMLRIILINMQQIGELDTSISLSRVNFIYDCKMKGNKKLGTLEKGFVKMYIIPRGDTIYSEKYKKLISGRDILNSFANKLDKKKEYYIGLPTEMIVHEFKFEDMWGFDKDKYDKHVKGELSKRKFQRTIRLTTLQAYILLTKLSEFRRLKSFNLSNAKDKKMYDVLYKFFEKLKSFFDDNPDKVIALERFYGNVYKGDNEDNT